MSIVASPGPPLAACPICGGRIFVPGPKGRVAPNGKMPRCAGCGSLERHRMFRRMFERLGTARFGTMRAIQFSAEPTLDPRWFASFELSVYGVQNSMDIQAIERPDNSYDLVVCSHVLEHVADDRKALGELLRITTDEGFLYLAVPDPFREEKSRDWGFAKSEKHGHFRVYGTDIALRFAAYLPHQVVLAYVGDDPATGERDGCFLVAKSAATRGWIMSQLAPDCSVFCGAEQSFPKQFAASY